MELAILGLGRMGANMARRLVRGGHRVVGYNRSYEVTEGLAKEDIEPAKTIEDAVRMLAKPRVLWVMVPAGDVTEKTVSQLSEILEPGDIIIDGGNSYFKDDARRAGELRGKGLQYLDVGTSGGLWGLERGYCIMVGGEEQTFRKLEPIFKTLAPGRGTVAPAAGRKPGSSAEEGYLYCGPAGAGHFVKMVHNGIEYGMMQAFAEGFDIMKNADSKSLAPEIQYDLKLEDIAELWRRGSVVSSWLLDLAANALAEQPTLDRFEGSVGDSGEGRWTVQTAIEESVPAEVITAALFARFRSRQDHTFAEKLLSALRFQFGGHPEGHGPHGK
jgi:6-phosphogluconate dehydrogenase